MNYSDLKPASTKPTIGVSFEFQRDGNPLDAVTIKHRNYVDTVLNESNLFSSVESADSDSDLYLDLVINNVVNSYAGAIFKGIISGLTFEFIGTSITDNYKVHITSKRADKDGFVRDYDWGIISTSGLIHSTPEGHKFKSIDLAFNEMIKQILIKYLAQMQEEGQL